MTAEDLAVRQVERWTDRLLSLLSQRRRERKALLAKTIKLEQYVEDFYRRLGLEGLIRPNPRYGRPTSSSWRIEASHVATETMADRDHELRRIGDELRAVVVSFASALELNIRPLLAAGQRSPLEILGELRQRLQYLLIPAINVRRRRAFRRDHQVGEAVKRESPRRSA